MFGDGCLPDALSRTSPQLPHILNRIAIKSSGGGEVIRCMKQNFSHTLGDFCRRKVFRRKVKSEDERGIRMPVRKMEADVSCYLLIKSVIEDQSLRYFVSHTSIEETFADSGDIVSTGFLEHRLDRLTN